MGRTWDELGTNLGRTWDKLGTNLGRTWDKLGTNLGQTLDELWTNFGEFEQVSKDSDEFWMKGFFGSFFFTRTFLLIAGPKRKQGHRRRFYQQVENRPKNTVKI